MLQSSPFLCSPPSSFFPFLFILLFLLLVATKYLFHPLLPRGKLAVVKGLKDFQDHSCHHMDSIVTQVKPKY